MVYCGDMTRQWKKGFGLKAISCGKATGKLMENNGYFSRFVRTDSSQGQLSVLGDKISSSSEYREGIFLVGNLCPAFR